MQLTSCRHKKAHCSIIFGPIYQCNDTVQLGTIQSKNSVTKKIFVAKEKGTPVFFQLP
jgi:Zn-finger protein